MLLDIAIETCGIEPADQIGTEPDGLVEQLWRAWACQNAALGKGDELNIDQAAIFIAHAQDCLQRLEADRAVDHDVAAHLRGAVADAEIELVARPHVHRR